MQSNLIKEIIVSVVLVILAVLFLNPFDFLMPDAVTMILIAIFLVVFAGFAAFVWHERVADEREAAHAAFAGRMGYLAGTGVLILGIVVQALEHQMSYWIVGGLVAMILVKIVARAWSEARN